MVRSTDVFPQYAARQTSAGLSHGVTNLRRGTIGVGIQPHAGIGAEGHRTNGDSATTRYQLNLLVGIQGHVAPFTEYKYNPPACAFGSERVI